MKLTWQKGTCPVFGDCFSLEGLPDGASGSARRSGKQNPKAPRFVAMAFINGRFMLHCAGTLGRARRALEREIDRRSIGLFGVDAVSFEMNA